MAREKKFKSFVENGHIFELEDGEVVSVEGPGYHDYVMCIVCYDSECWACKPGFKNQVCEKREDQPTLPGLEYLQEKK